MLSRKAKYAINALVYLTKKQGQGPILISQIAKEKNIPRKFLEAILLDLRNAGILSSKKGKGGGYYLRKDPESVTLVEIMRLMDGPIALLPCVSLQFYESCEECQDEESCGLRSVFLDVRDQTLGILGDATLSKIVQREGEASGS